jgi:hypothetical protein
MAKYKQNKKGKRINEPGFVDFPMEHMVRDPLDLKIKSNISTSLYKEMENYFMFSSILHIFNRSITEEGILN